MNCENCSHTMRPGLAEWHWECPNCGLEASTLEPADLAEGDRVVDEIDREAGLEKVRKTGFATTFSILREWRSEGRLLDVGCAHGWFLDEGRLAGFACTGIEPSARVAAKVTARGHQVLSGYFPDVLTGERGFDVVSFNDVFEHIPRASETMEAARSVLVSGGVLSIAIPSSRGIFYRLSKLLMRFGAVGPFERMWQKHFSSPHLYYFNRAVLTQLAARQGFETVFAGTLPSVRVAGLWDRLSYDTRSSRLGNMITYVAVIAAAPFLQIMPADIDLLMFRKTEKTASASDLQ